MTSRGHPPKLLGMTRTVKQPFGRPSIFRNKTGGSRVQGVITARGSVRFEQARRRLAKLASREIEHISDADVIEYLARGDSETVVQIEKFATT